MVGGAQPHRRRPARVGCRLKWTCDITTTGYLIDWDGSGCEMPSDASVLFYTGMDEDSLVLSFTADIGDGSHVVVPGDSDVIAPNASARLKIESASAVTLFAGPVMPLLPGLATREMGIFRKLVEDHRKYSVVSGSEGQLYRRKLTGTPCPDCCDPVTKAKLRNNCTTCDGSGRVTGWDGPYVTYVIWSSHHHSDVTGSGAGTNHESVQDRVRLSCMPRPRTDDRLLLSGGRVFAVGQPQETVCGVSGLPAVMSCAVRHLDPDSAAGEIPDDWLE